MSELTVIFGAGAIGMPVARALAARGDDVRIAQRSVPGDLPRGVAFMPCDILDRDAVRAALEGATEVLFAVGFTYDSRVWRTAWPAAMTHVVEACAAVDARLVFIDNLYQLGPQDTPRREDMPLTTQGAKPPILAEVTRLWKAASGRVRVAALRCPDFYGPGVDVSHIGASGLGKVARGQAAWLLAPPDTPHDFAYVPDIVRAAVTLLDAPDDAYGQVWNMPCAPTRTPRQILQLGAAAMGRPLKLRWLPMWSWPLLGLFSRFIKEVADVGFTWDRPYVVDASKFRQRFWSDVTPFEVGAEETVRAYARMHPATGTASPAAA